VERAISNKLIEWKMAEDRKVLLIRGARQVGKTFSIRKLGAGFKYFLEVNFDFDVPVRQFFEATHDPVVLCEKLSGYYSIPCIPGKTLLFFDEIQSCPEAIQSLRYFNERMQKLHVVAAGSLLEFALGEISSFGVGRISSLYMYPLTFKEFAEAVEGAGFASFLEIPPGEEQVDPVFHSKFLELFRTYSITGGMPAVVKKYTESRDLPGCLLEQDELVSTFRDDFAKYKTKISQLKLFECFKSAAMQSGGKFVYRNISQEGSVGAYKTAIELLDMAGLVHRVYHTSGNGIPPGAEIDSGKFKVIIFDLGLHQRLLGLVIRDLLTLPVDGFVNKGNIAEVFAGLEILAAMPPNMVPQLYYWHREARSSNAEVDYLIQKGTEIVPVEVKSGNRGSMQSLSVFMAEKKSSYGIRLSAENRSKFKNIEILPLYLASKIVS
jgi:predicted AAA+ superfamily ATPase